MVSHVVVSFLAELFHTDRTPFFMFWFTICGASSARMATVIASRTVGVSQRILASSIIIFIHMTFLVRPLVFARKIISLVVSSLFLSSHSGRDCGSRRAHRRSPRHRVIQPPLHVIILYLLIHITSTFCLCCLFSVANHLCLDFRVPEILILFFTVIQSL